MAQIASEDYVNKLIYLHLDTTTNGFDPAEMQKEHRALRRLNANGERKFDPMVSFVGNEPKGGGNYTPPSTRLRQGVRIIPYDTGVGSQYSMGILNEILNVDDGLADQGVFDRSSVDANVDIDKDYDPVEVKLVSSGSGLDEGQDTKLTELHALRGAGDYQLEVTENSIKIPSLGITINVTKVGDKLVYERA